MKRNVLVIFFLILLLNIPYVYACDCPRPGSVEEEMIKSDLVFIGKVSDTKIWEKTTMVVTKQFAGEYFGEIIVLHGSGDCSFLFEEGKEYLVYAYRRDGKLFVLASHCGRTKELKNAQDDLAKLEEIMANSAYGTRIYKVMHSLDFKDTTDEIKRENK